MAGRCRSIYVLIVRSRPGHLSTLFRSSGFCLGSPNLHPGKDSTCASSAMPSAVQARTLRDPSKQAVSSPSKVGWVQAASAQSRHASHHTGSYSAPQSGGHKVLEAAGGHVQISYWVSFFLQSIRSTHPPSVSRALGHFGARGARDHPRVRLPPGLLITRHLRR